MLRSALSDRGYFPSPGHRPWRLVDHRLQLTSRQPPGRAGRRLIAPTHGDSGCPADGLDSRLPRSLAWLVISDSRLTVQRRPGRVPVCPAKVVRELPCSGNFTAAWRVMLREIGGCFLPAPMVTNRWCYAATVTTATWLVAGGTESPASRRPSI